MSTHANTPAGNAKTTAASPKSDSKPDQAKSSAANAKTDNKPAAKPANK